MLQELKAALKIKPKIRELRLFGVLLALVLVIVASKFGLEYLIWLTLVLLAMVVVAPRLLRPIVIVLLILTVPIGWIISRLVLIVFFYLVVTPVALIRRLLRHDPLNLRPQKDQATYWEELEPNRNYDKMYL